MTFKNATKYLLALLLLMTFVFSTIAQNQIEVYPNPAYKFIKVSYASHHSYNIVITNLIGTVVYRKTIDSPYPSVHSIDLSHASLNLGMYLIKIEVKSRIMAQKRLIIKPL